MKRSFLSIFLALILGASLCGCGAKGEAPAESKQNVTTENTTETTADTTKEVETEARSSKEMYMDFLAGTEKVYTEKVKTTYYDYEVEDYVPFFDAKDSFAVTGLMKKVIEVEHNDYDLLLTDFSYCLIDCGLDGEPELALHTSYDIGYTEDLEIEFVIKNIDGKLQLCYMMESYYRSFKSLTNIGGVINTYDSYGAASSCYGTRFIDANGDYQFVYDEEESYWAVYSLDERFEGLINEEEIENNELYLTFYDFVEYSEENRDEMLAKRMYCAEFGPDVYYDGNEEDNLAVLESVFQEANVRLYSRDEVNQAVANREKELGLTAQIKDSDYVEWTAYDVDYNEINGIREVTVNSVEEFMKAIDARTCIVLAPGEYNVTDWLCSQIREDRVSYYYNYDEETDSFYPAENYGEPQIFYCGTEEEPGLILKSFDYCTLKSADASNPATIVSDPRGEDVVDFFECTGLTLENIVFGHTDGDDGCAGDVLHFSSCEEVVMNNCDLYGCGATGIDLFDCYNFNISNTVIHDCSVGGIYISDSYGVDVAHSTIENIDGYGMLSVSGGGVTFVECTFREGGSPMFGDWMDGYIEFYSCTFDPVLKEEILNNELYGEYINIYE